MAMRIEHKGVDAREANKKMPCSEQQTFDVLQTVSHQRECMQMVKSKLNTTSVYKVLEHCNSPLTL